MPSRRAAFNSLCDIYPGPFWNPGPTPLAVDEPCRVVPIGVFQWTDNTNSKVTHWVTMSPYFPGPDYPTTSGTYLLGDYGAAVVIQVTGDNPMTLYVYGVQSSRFPGVDQYYRYFCSDLPPY